MAELDGVWDVERVSGALPPLAGVSKRIAGGRGTTRVLAAPVGWFDVDGAALRYRPRWLGVVDELEPDGAGGWRGRTLVHGREVGRFALRRRAGA